jgi:aarF domain-containing kinase
LRYLSGSAPVQTTRADDILPVLDEWAFKFYREMDYRKEGAIMSRFAADLEPLSGIRIPSAFTALTTRRVLVTEWIDGEKLSESKAEDVRELCTTLLNAYLIQLLDTGLLHADPHPGAPLAVRAMPKLRA